jgi:quercetin dioxygenase-like cupin family protein
MTLDSFCQRFLDQQVGMMHGVNMYDFGAVKSVVVYRDPPYQVELFMIRAGLGAVDAHRHPQVDSIEVGIFGAMGFVVNGKTYEMLPGSRLRVGPRDWHSTVNLPVGAAFYSVQKWDDGVVPSSVGLNWEGSIMSLAGIEHLKLIRKAGNWWKLKKHKMAA